MINIEIKTEDTRIEMICWLLSNTLEGDELYDMNYEDVKAIFKEEYGI